MTSNAAMLHHVVPTCDGWSLVEFKLLEMRYLVGRAVQLALTLSVYPVRFGPIKSW